MQEEILDNYNKEENVETVSEIEPVQCALSDEYFKNLHNAVEPFQLENCGHFACKKCWETTIQNNIKCKICGQITVQNIYTDKQILTDYFRRMDLCLNSIYFILTKGELCTPEEARGNYTEIENFIF